MTDYLRLDRVGAALVQELHAAHPTLISRDELERELDDRIAVTDTLNYLERAGLVHRLKDAEGKEFFWMTRTAMAGEIALTAEGSADGDLGRKIRKWGRRRRDDAT